MKFFVIALALSGVALAGSEPAKVAASSCHGRSTVVSRHRDRVADRFERRADRLHDRAERLSSSGCHGK